MILSSRTLATVVTVAVIMLGAVGYCAYGVWLEQRVDRVFEGMTKAEVRDSAGEPDAVRTASDSEFGCSKVEGAEVWTYELTGNSQAIVVFNGEGRVICKSFFFIAI